MLPKNTLRDRRLERLRIFSDSEAGPLAGNVLKRWEDNTLPADPPAAEPSFRRARGFPRGNAHLEDWWATVQERGWQVENPPRVWKTTRDAVAAKLHGKGQSATPLAPTQEPTSPSPSA
jgi:hypothetical protein